jgi:hypothetical protein
MKYCPGSLSGGSRDIKSSRRSADTTTMMISDEQLECVLSCMRSGVPAGCIGAEPRGISPEFSDRVRSYLSRAPDIRPDRIASARERMAGGEPDPHEIAAKMIARLVSDSIR